MVWNRGSGNLRLESLKLARWWRELLNCKKFDNGDTNPTLAILTEISLEGKERIDHEKADRFESELARLIDEGITDQKYGRFHVIVDYHPDMILSNALELAEIENDLMVLPWKTISFIDLETGIVKGAIGYGSSFEEI